MLLNFNNFLKIQWHCALVLELKTEPLNVRPNSILSFICLWGFISL